MSATRGPTVSTWPTITDYVAARAPVPVSVDSVMRWAKRKSDPLPIRRWGPRDRPRVYCLVSELDQWIARQHHGDEETP
jgi:hypothetical protein